MQNIVSFSAVSVGSKTYRVIYCEKKAKRARSIFKNESEIHIKIPRHWDASSKKKIYEELLKKSIFSIESGKWKIPLQKKYSFFDGQSLEILSTSYRISIRTSQAIQVPVFGDLGEILDFVIPYEFSEEKTQHFIEYSLILKFKPLLIDRINLLNHSLFFNKQITEVQIKNNKSNWGSCSKSGRIILNFKLLFFPLSILDYVVVHELSHFDHHNHGKLFWKRVESAFPSYKIASKWLRKDASTYLLEKFSSS